MIKVREAERGDAETILRFIGELADYEKAANEVVATVQHIEQSLFGPDAVAHAVICTQDGVSIGFAVYFFNYSTWLGKLGLFLEDLYVHPRHRGSGAGKALLSHLAGIAVSHDCERFEWNVLTWNEPAIAFYEALGAVAQSEWVGYRMTGIALTNLAASR